MTVTALEKTPVVVAAESINEGDEEILFSNVSVVNTLLSELLTEDEIADNALRSYYADFYLTQMLNGGFAQFIYESGWQADINERILEALNAMGATDHAAVFEKAVTTFEDLSDDEKEYFLEGDFEVGLDDEDDAEQEGEDTFDDVDEAFYQVNEREDLTAKNAGWLRTLPELRILPTGEIASFVEECVARIPDLEERREAADELLDDDMPEFERTIRVLCEVADQELEAITIGDPSFQWEGSETLAWHFITDAGEYLMVETEDEALMIDGETREVVAAVEFDDDDEFDEDDEDELEDEPGAETVR